MLKGKGDDLQTAQHEEQYAEQKRDGEHVKASGQRRKFLFLQSHAGQSRRAVSRKEPLRFAKRQHQKEQEQHDHAVKYCDPSAFQREKIVDDG